MASLTDAFRPPKNKTCTACKIEKPLKDFPKNNDNRDRRHNKCRACFKEVEDKKKADKAEYSKKYFTF